MNGPNGRFIINASNKALKSNSMYFRRLPERLIKNMLSSVHTINCTISELMFL